MPFARSLAILAVLAATPAAAAEKPQRIMSINGCTDLLLLQLAPKSRIASVTYRARDAARAFSPGLADGVATNDGRPEEVVHDRPDLVIAGRYTTPAAKALARRAGIRVLELDDPNDFAGIRSNTLALGAALGEPERARALVRRMDAVLAGLAASTPPRRYVVAAWSGGPVVLGQGTLTDAIIRAAGAVNVAADQSALGYGDFDLERLLQTRPEALLQTDPRLARPTLQGAQARHRLVRRLYRGRTVAIADTLYNCGLPQSADAAADLRRALAGIRGG